MVSESDKEKASRLLREKRVSTAARVTKTVAKKAVDSSEKKASPVKKAAVKKEKPATTAVKRQAVAAKGTTRKRTTAVPPPELIEAGPDVIVIPPHSTIEGAQSHVAAIGPDSVVAVRTTNYEVTPPHQIIEPVYPEERASELPPGYGDTRLVLMVRDPEWIFFYWEVGQTAREMLGLPLRGHIPSLVVRLHDITDIEEFNGTNSLAWYEIPLTEGAASWYIHLPQVAREWCGELGVLNEHGEFIQICRSNVARTPRNFIAEHSDPEWMSASHELREILARSADVFVSSRLGSEAAIRQISRRLRVAVERHVASGAAPASMRAARIIQQAVQAAVAELPLTVRTELIVSGMTDSRAQVTIQEQPVAVRPDGSFTIRFELPDGEQVIPVKAVSADGTMSREIIPVVRRETHRPSEQ